jgi:L-threonylcarbamoyladenylate synthase
MWAMACGSTRRQTRRLAADAASIAEAAAMLRVGGLVAFPTETVYGLGAHALDVQAVLGIFEAKSRPADDPLIVHLGHADDVEAVGRLNPLARQLAERFWPGPLTLVVEKRDVVPAEVTAGLDTVAVRVPAHPVALALLEAAGLPIAAPSANLFGRPSPTRAEHVLHDLDGRIDAVVFGGPTRVGVESTIVDVSTGSPRLLRPGGLAAEEIEAVLGRQLLPPPAATPGAQVAPGLLAAHYSPRTPLVLILGSPAAAQPGLLDEVRKALAEAKRVGVLCLEDDRAMLPEAACVEVVGAWSTPGESAARLFDALRTLDSGGFDVLFARELADASHGLGRALADRLRRAAGRVVDTSPAAT